MKVKADSPFCNCLFFTANALGRAMTKHAEMAFAHTGLAPSHAFVVMAVNREPGIGAGALAEAMQLERSTITRLIDHAEQQGWVRRAAEGRTVQLYPTSQGRAADAKLRKAWRALYEDYARILGGDPARKLTDDTYSAFKKLQMKSKPKEK